MPLSINRSTEKDQQISLHQAQLKMWNAKEQWHPMGHPNDSLKNPPLIINKGEGVHIEDLDGNRYVDGVGGLWNINCGYGRSEIKEAIVNQLDELVYYSTFRGTSHPRSIELSHRLMQMTQPENMKRVFYSSGGSDAMETAMKLARQYWKVLGQKDRFKFISLKDGYHGTHFGAASVTGGDRFRKGCEPALPGCYHIESPWMYRNIFTEDDPVLLGQKCAEMLDRTITHLGPATVAAFIAEPVLGAGGVIVPPENFFPLCREICDKHGVLFIADEVICGFGRTGAMFGTRGWGVAPDIMTAAKGITSGYIPLGATLFNERIDEAFANNKDGDGYIAHGYTYSGHPLGCAAALAALDIVEKENLPANAGKQGEYMLNRLKPFVEKYEAVGNVRGKGLMIALELVSDKKTKTPCSKPYISAIYKATLKHGAIVRTSGNKIILSPPLIIQKEEIDVIVDALEGAFETVKS